MFKSYIKLNTVRRFNIKPCNKNIECLKNEQLEKINKSICILNIVVSLMSFTIALSSISLSKNIVGRN